MFPERLEGDGFTLRPVTPADAEHMLTYVNLPVVYEGTSADPWTIEGLRHFAEQNLAGMAEGRWCRYAIVPDGSSMPAGSIGLCNVDLRNKRAEIGYDLAPDEWGKGLAGRAASALLAWAFANGFHRIEATVLEGNTRSERVLAKLGFQREATLRDYKWVRGEFRDFSLWARIRDETLQ